MIIEFFIIDPDLDLQVQHLISKDTRLFEALTRKKRITISVPDDSEIVALKARIKALEDQLK